MTTLKILGIDDELGMRVGIERALSDYVVEIPDIKDEINFEIMLAETGEEAIEMIKNDAPDILLLDYKLPGINGLEVLEQTAGHTDEMLTIMITAYASIETAIAATKQGAYDFLPKPFTPADLKHTVRKAATRIILARRARELEAERKSVRFEFIRVLGHELKAPLSSVSSYLYILRDHVLGDNVDAYDEVIRRSCMRLDQMRKMIVDLLDMTRLESGQKQRDLQDIDLREAVEDSVDLVKEDAKNRGIKIAVEGADCVLFADRQEVGMIMNNLISNAVKYNRDEGTVDVALKRQDNAVIVKVADTGIGMTAEEKAKLFGEFVRMKNEKTRNILGSGLGLSILKKLVDLYEGSIEVETEYDKGSTFIVTLKDAVKEEAA